MGRPPDRRSLTPQGRDRLAYARRSDVRHPQPRRRLLDPASEAAVEAAVEEISRPRHRRGEASTVAGEVKNFVPVTDEMLRKPGSWRLADVSRQLSRVELQPAQGNHRAECRRPRAGLGVGDGGRRREPVASARARRHPLSAEPEQYRPGARREDRQPDLGTARRTRAAHGLRRASKFFDLAGQDSRLPQAMRGWSPSTRAPADCLWETRVGDPDKGHFATSGSIAINGKVLQGLSGCARFTG